MCLMPVALHVSKLPYLEKILLGAREISKLLTKQNLRSEGMSMVRMMECLTLSRLYYIPQSYVEF